MIGQEAAAVTQDTSLNSLQRLDLMATGTLQSPNHGVGPHDLDNVTFGQGWQALVRGQDNHVRLVPLVADTGLPSKYLMSLDSNHQMKNLTYRPWDYSS